jgi:NAD(P)-dependent dehydrogenase (short-subunit alcohol dehydrogenase family)
MAPTAECDIPGEFVFKADNAIEPTNIAHVISGGVGGMGILMANLLAKKGNKSVVLLSRRDAIPSESQEMYDDLANSSCQIIRRRVNSASTAANAEVLKDNTLHPPIAGVTHGAGVLRDGMINTQNRSKFQDVFQPKYNGAWILHHLTANKPWEVRDFVMYSSYAAVAGNAGQSNHAAANCGMDMLAAFRNVNALSASAVNLGAIAEIGYAARHMVAGNNAKQKGGGIFGAMEAAVAKESPKPNVGPPNQESEDKK